jgi:hypothetical protein
MTDRILATSGDWAVASDGVQWILQRRQPGGHWRAVSFVRSERSILARCMREKGCEAPTADILLSGLPDTFNGMTYPRLKYGRWTRLAKT